MHVHVPAGAVPKDGPSAGVTMTTALASLLSGRPVRSDVAMTGEVSLTGRVLPIGGVKQKLLAAHRAGITTVLIPQRNEPDLDDVPAEVLEKLDVHTVGDVREVLRSRSSPPGRSRPGQTRPGQGPPRWQTPPEPTAAGRRWPPDPSWSWDRRPRRAMGDQEPVPGVARRSRPGPSRPEAEAAARLRRQGGRRRRDRAVLAFRFRRGSPRRRCRAVWPGRAPPGPVAAGRARPRGQNRPGRRVGAARPMSPSAGGPARPAGLRFSCCPRIRARPACAPWPRARRARAASTAASSSAMSRPTAITASRSRDPASALADACRSGAAA